MAKIYKDFDEFFQTKEDVMVVKIFDTEYELPASINAKIALSLAKTAKQNPDQEMDAEGVLELLELLYGEENINEWLDNGISIEQLSQVLMWTMQQYGQAKVDVPGQKKRKAPVKKTVKKQ